MVHGGVLSIFLSTNMVLYLDMTEITEIKNKNKSHWLVLSKDVEKKLLLRDFYISIVERTPFPPKDMGE